MIVPAPAAAFAYAASPPGRPAYVAACPRTRARIVSEPVPVPPPDYHASSPQVQIVADYGSDGRVRRVAVVTSSGDPRLDDAAATAVSQAKIAPASFACISPSGLMLQTFPVPVEALAAPEASATPGAVAPPAGSPSPRACDAPFVQTTGFAIPPRRERAGTAAVAVSLDAAGHVQGVHLAHSSGSAKADYAAAVAARTGRYVLVPAAGCAASATTYRLELTFR
jgi:TonB family protein